MGLLGRSGSNYFCLLTSASSLRLENQFTIKSYFDSIPQPGAESSQRRVFPSLWHGEVELCPHNWLVFVNKINIRQIDNIFNKCIKLNCLLTSPVHCTYNQVKIFSWASCVDRIFVFAVPGPEVIKDRSDITTAQHSPSRNSPVVSICPVGFQSQVKAS